MRAQRSLAILSWAALTVALLSACVAAPAHDDAEFDADVAASHDDRTAPHDGYHDAYVVRHRLHTGLALSADLLADTPLAFVLDLPEPADYYEIGLGDEVYYQLPRAGTSRLRRNALAARAMLLPTRAVMQVMPLSAHPAELPHTDIAPLALTSAQLASLVDAMVATFADTDVEAAWAGERPRQWFFNSHRRFWLRYTCNSWTANALTEAEQASWVVAPIRASAVMRPFNAE
ncbi:DUF2459 domain-containing protein [Alcanivorax sp. JB21]|uniref:DUF2459 domain-containing protein n=1 Tax=Alcanivorax limicola TaxID=2874102 RepID=UPI001CBC9C44|nr:DUF2459 domain-containing protein [Alcanivorax limicola]MBZ2190026.1 DUF2459 domain-containing protein [Alcanivorax limicola]